MAKIDQTILLQRAEGEFLQGNFKDALRNYSLILEDYPSLDEAVVGVYLSDLGIEHKEEAHALFDYYQAIKKEKEDAVDIVLNLIETLENAKNEINKLLTVSIEEQVEYSDGIRYSDFLLLVENRGDFKLAFEDIMFSSRVVITNKEDFIDFVTRLSMEGFQKMALEYLDATSHLFGNDQEILALYHVVSGK